MTRNHIISVMASILALNGSWESFGRTSFQWLNNTLGSLQDQNGTNIPARGATILTYISNDSVINALGSVVGNKLILQASYGDDQFTWYRLNGFIGRLTTGLMTEESDIYVGKYVYGIVLNLPYDTFETTYRGDIANLPKDGSIYAGFIVAQQGPPDPVLGGPLQKLDPPGLPPIPDEQFYGRAITNLQVIPEPGAAMLMLAGIAGISLARRIHKVFPG